MNQNKEVQYTEATLYKGDREKETVCDGYVDEETGEVFYS